MKLDYILNNITDSATPRTLDSDLEQNLRRDQIAIEVILDHAPELKINSTEDIYIRLPLLHKPSSRKPDNSTSNERKGDELRFIPIRDRRVRAEIAELIYTKTKIILFEHELSRILTVLEGMAWKKPIQEIKADQILDENPLIEAIYLFLKQREKGLEFNGTCSSLLSELTRIGKRKGIDLNSKYWPGGPAQLSKKLGEQKNHLKKVGIEFTRGRRPGGERYVNISLQSANSQSKESDDAECRASQQVSDDQQLNSNQKPNCDTGDDALEAKFASINQLSKENKDD